MNCKPGDLALIVNATTEKRHIGKIVRVLGRYEHGDQWGWKTQPELLMRDGRGIAWLDRSLRPIRDNDGQDETLRIAGLPKQDLLTEGYRLIEQLDEIAEIAKGFRK